MSSATAGAAIKTTTTAAAAVPGASPSATAIPARTVHQASPTAAAGAITADTSSIGIGNRKTTVYHSSANPPWYRKE